MTTFLDEAKKIREGEELEIAKLEPYLLQQIPGSKPPLVVEQFPSGHSNLTYLLKLGDQELVLRRPPFGSKVKSAHDMGREYRILSHLNPVYPFVPKPLAFEESGELMGVQFYVMERLKGIILRRSIPEGLGVTPEIKRKMDEAFIDKLAEMHMLDYKAAGLGDLGKPEGYVERQVTGWTKRYAASKTDDIETVDQCAKWLADKLPAESGAGLIHNDYKYDNLVLDAQDPTKIIGILDWEMSTVGDPLMDLGTALGYWVEETDDDMLKMIAFGPTMTPGSMTRRELAERYAKKTGYSIDKLDFYYVFALFKTAVVLQQIYYRYHQGLTKDERFANFIYAVRILTQKGVDVINQSKL
jgi:aminoglycoside phosphotransferase (APT) family kinase protein